MISKRTCNCGYCGLRSYLLLQCLQLCSGRFRIFEEIFCDERFVNELAVDAGPDPLSSAGPNEPAQILIPAGIERAEAVGTVLILEMMTWIILAVALSSGLQWRIGHFANETGIIGNQAIRAEAKQPGGFLGFIYRPWIYLEAAPMCLLKEPGVASPGEYGIGSGPQCQLHRLNRQRGDDDSCSKIRDLFDLAKTCVVKGCHY